MPNGDGVRIEGGTANNIGLNNQGNTISGNLGFGIVLGGQNSSANYMQGNRIGVNEAGTAKVANGLSGLSISNGASNNIIGQTDVAAGSGFGNIISGNVLYGVIISAGLGLPPTGNVVSGNFIGTATGGTTDLGNGNSGVFISTAASNKIGSVLVSEKANVIAYNHGSGIVVQGTSSLSNRISRNSVFSNSGLGIDLGGDGVTANDAGDGDTGPNDLQNYPVFSQASYNGQSTIITGTIDTNLTGLILELFLTEGQFSNQGKTFKPASVSIDSANHTFTATYVGQNLSNQYMTATATSQGGSTSEFSAAIRVDSGVIAMITVVTPNGGENWPVGKSQNILWTFAGFTGKVNIELSRNGPSGTFVQPAELFNVPNNGLIAWTVTGPGSTNCYFKITSVSTPSISDLSNSAFTISSITVQAPNGGETWALGTTPSIRWSSVGVTGDVKIELSRNGSLEPFETILGTTPNDGVEPWTVTGAISNNCLMRISSVTTPAITDISDAVFFITAAPPPASITVSAPNGGEIWYAGTTQTIRWSYTGDPGPSVQIDLLKGGVFSSFIYTGAPIGSGGNGSFSWPIDRMQTPGINEYSVKVSSTTTGSVTDTSDSNFTIRAPFITVMSPNGTEDWAIGTGQIITWISTGVTENVKIDLSRDGSTGTFVTLYASVANTGSQPWTVTGTASMNCFVKISSVVVASTNDLSNAAFIISGTAPTSSITVRTPNGGECWELTTIKDTPTTKDIVWDMDGVTAVNIDLSRNGGTSWENLFTGIGGTYNPNATTGKYSQPWPLSGPTSTQCRIRITKYLAATPTDTSDGNFTLANAPDCNISTRPISQ